MVSLCKYALNTLKNKTKQHIYLCLCHCGNNVQQTKSIHGNCHTKVAFISFQNRQLGLQTNSSSHENSATVGIRTRVLWKN